MKNIIIFGVSNGVGITRDMEIIKNLLVKSGYNVEMSNPFKFQSDKKFDASIFLERFSEKVLDVSPINIFIPNQEWFEPHWLPSLKKFKVVFAKTKYAESIFKKLNCITEYISFTSDDRYLPEVSKDEYHWVHIVGKSIQKQTNIVWETWNKNPGFPKLTIIEDPSHFKNRPVLRNLNYMYDRLSDDMLKFVQNNFFVHVCPSLTEGFGHYINEAMSCKSLIISTNAEPMTEFVNEENGVLVEAVKQEQMRLSISNIISVESLEKAVIRAMVMDFEDKVKLGEKCREKYIKNDLFFKEALVNNVKKYVG